MDIQRLTDTRLAGVYQATIELSESFPEFCARFASLPGTVALLSGGNLDCARYHILAARPWLTVSARGRSLAVTAQGATSRFSGHPLEALQQIIHCFDLRQYDLPGPVAAGLFGYLAYDLKDVIEDLPRTTVDDLGLPHLYMVAPSIVVVHDTVGKTTRLCIPKRIVSGRDVLDEDLVAYEHLVAQPCPANQGFAGDASDFRSNFTRGNYMEAIRRIRDYIARGHVYQVNMSQRFEMGFQGSSYELFARLYQMNPAPFFAYIHAGDHQIVSTSPERFLLRDGERVETRPIKGTRPRGKTAAEDQAFRDDLARSPKDDAELSMIVDLLRNDIGKVCRGGSVRVTAHKSIEAYQNVYHLVSIVEGRLGEGFDSVDLIGAAFPGGSITGCPKIRSMEIIDELETHRRHVYTGSIGYISFHDTMDLSIAIRTATVAAGKIVFSVGGGIVYDSDPSDEFDETLHKGQTLMKVFQEGGEPVARPPVPSVWLNGALKPADQACVPVSDAGLQYGFGVFETIRVDRGNPGHLDLHMARFNAAWNDLFGTPSPDLTWDEVIRLVVEKNRLTDQVAAVKLLATRGEPEKGPFPHNLMVSARPYVHRLSGKQAGGLELALYPEPRQSPLANYKSLNYLYYLRAGQWAAASGFDEALILNPDGTVSETNTANILLIEGSTVIRPQSPCVLPGVMEKAVCRVLGGWGHTIVSRPIRPETLFDADLVILTNSLMGAVPALSLDGNALAAADKLCAEINAQVL